VDMANLDYESAIYWSTVLAFTFGVTASFTAQLMWSYLWGQAERAELMDHIQQSNADVVAKVQQLNSNILSEVRKINIEGQNRIIQAYNPNQAPRL